MGTLVTIVDWVFRLFIFGIVIQVVLSYFMDAWNPVRRFIDRIYEPLYAPIRRLLPKTGVLDFSPFILIIILTIIERLLVTILVRL
jgi:YggT family protein